MKKIISILFSLIFVCSFIGSTVTAEYISEDVEVNTNYSESVHEPQIQRIGGGNCLNCEYPGMVFIVCLENYWIADRGYHTYGLFDSNECYATYYRCASNRMCLMCGYIAERYSQHDCLEVHEDCGRGEYNVCPCDDKISNYPNLG